MITLHQFPPGFGLPNASPFCMKVETYLRLAGLPYETDNRGRLPKAPKGKLPYLDDDGECVADSTFIIAYLKERYGDPLDAGLSAEQRATALAWQRLIEENLYWAVAYTRWIEPAGFALMREVFFSRLPWPLRRIVPPLARRAVQKELWGHGLGRHSRDEIMAIGQADVDAIAVFLGDKTYFLGESPTSLDATAYAFLANILWAPVDSPIRRHAQVRPRLEAYCRRLQARYWPDSMVA